MAQSATTKQGDFFVSLVKEAEILDGPVDLGSFGETTIQLHSLEDLCLAMMPLVSDPDARLEEFNAVFSAAADWDNVEDLLGGVADDLEILEPEEEMLLRTIVLGNMGEMMLKSSQPEPKYQQRMSVDADGAGVYTTAMEVLNEPEKFGWEKSWPTRFGPMLFTLIGLCNFTQEHHTFFDGDAEEIGEFLAKRFDPFLRMVQLEAPHLKLHSKHPFPQQVRQWVKDNVRGVARFDDEEVMSIVLDVFHNMGLINIDPGCGGICCNSYAWEVLVEPQMYATLMWQTLPSFVSDSDRPIALLDSLVSYLGGPAVAEQLEVKPIELYSRLRTLAAEMGDKDAREALKYNYIVRCIFGIQKANFKRLGDKAQLTEMGQKVMRYALAKNVDTEAESWVTMRQDRRAS